jgi:hypothetical protein
VPLHRKAGRIRKRLSPNAQGKVRYELKTPYRDGTTYVIFEPLDFIAKLTHWCPNRALTLGTSD